MKIFEKDGVKRKLCWEENGKFFPLNTFYKYPELEFKLGVNKYKSIYELNPKLKDHYYPKLASFYQPDNSYEEALSTLGRSALATGGYWYYYTYEKKEDGEYFEILKFEEAGDLKELFNQITPFCYDRKEKSVWELKNKFSHYYKTNVVVFKDENQKLRDIFGWEIKEDLEIYFERENRTKQSQHLETYLDFECLNMPYRFRSMYHKQNKNFSKSWLNSKILSVDIDILTVDTNKRHYCKLRESEYTVFDYLELMLFTNALTNNKYFNWQSREHPDYLTDVRKLKEDFKCQNTDKDLVTV